MTSNLKIRCKDCVHWDTDSETELREEKATVSRCSVPRENDYSAPMSIGHHRPRPDNYECQAFLITRSDFSCDVAQRRNVLN